MSVLVYGAVASIGLGAFVATAQEKTVAKPAAGEGQEFRLSFCAADGIEFPYETNSSAGGGGCAPPVRIDLTASKKGGACLALAGQEVAVATEPNKVIVDTDGDGKPDKVLKGTEGTATVSLERPGGERMPYAVRLFGDGEGNWTFDRWGYTSGKVEGVKITLIDENANGVYGEMWKDRIVVGDGAFAHPLSSVESLGGKLFYLDIDPSGTSVRTRPYKGEVGALDLTSAFRSKGKLESAVVTDNTNYFDVGGKGVVSLPVGTYKLYSGVVTARPQLAHLKQGAMKPFAIEAGKTLTPEWGTPVAISFKHEYAGGIVTIAPENTHVRGESGEEYFAFKPMAFTPTVVVRDMRADSVVQKGTMCLG